VKRFLTSSCDHLRPFAIAAVSILFALLIVPRVLLLDVPTCAAADPAFVGVLALAVEPENAQRLELSEETLENLKSLIDQRENAAINLALEIRELPPVARRERLQPFVAESERMGLAMLSETQRSRLAQLRIQRAGMATLTDPKMAERLSLSDEQMQQIQQLMSERAQAMTRGGEQERRVTRDTFERKLQAVLNEQQRATWDELAGLGPGPTAADTTGDVASAAEQQPAAADAEMQPEPTSDDASTTNDVAAADTAAVPATDSMTDNAADATVDETTEPSDAGESSSAESVADDEAAAAEVSAPMTDAEGEPILRFNFYFQPWEDVLDWLAEQADLSLQSDLVPEGTLNYRDNRSYSATEAIDLINGILLAKGYTLVRRGRLLSVVDLEDQIPDALVEFVPVEQLDERGRYELVKTVFHLAKIEPADAQQEIESILGPGRAMVVMPKSRQIMVTETAGTLRMIRDILEKAENPPTGSAGKVTEIKLANASAEEVMMIARPLLGLGEGENVGDDISVAIGPMGTRLFATGSIEALAKLQDVVLSVDVARQQEGDLAAAATEQPQLRTHPIQVADPEGALAVLQTLLAGSPDVRLALDPKTNKVIALARPSEHKTILDTIAQLEGEEAQFEVIQLRRIDPQLAVLTISNFFGSGDEEGTSSIKIDADPTTMKLYVRATKRELEQVRDLIAKLEETGSSSAVGSNLRYIPLGGDSAVSAVETAKRLWSRENRIEFVTPANSGPSSFDLREVSPDPPGQRDARPAPAPARQPQGTPSQPTATGEKAPAANGPPAKQPKPETSRDRTAQRSSRFQVPVRFVSQTLPAEDDEGDAASVTPEQSPANSTIQASKRGSDIRVEFTPEGVLIASDDTEALDEFEDLLRTIAGPQNLLPGKNFTVFFLKYCKAEVAQQLIQEILGGSSAASGGNLIGDVASNLLGGGGGILGALMGGGDGGDATTIQATGPVSIVADPRLNCLVIQAVDADLKLIEQLLKVIDREASITDVQTAGKPHIIPVVYLQAEDVASIVRDAYASRIATNAAQGGQRQPSPADFIRALRGGRGGRGGGDEARSEESKMTLTVDARSNSLIITAPEPLYLEVKDLVAQIDQGGLDQVEDVQVVTLKHTNPEAVQKVLANVLQSTSRPSSSSSARSSSQPAGGGGSPFGGASPEDIRRRMEFIQQMRSRGGFQPQGVQRGGSSRGGSSRGGPTGGNRGGSRGGRGR
jgi:type II secretory pathway component GspD/PulD (secretin)